MNFKIMKSKIQILLLIAITLCFNTFIETTYFVDEEKKIEKEVEAVEPIGNVEKSEEIREHLNQFYNDVCHHSADDLATDILIYTSYLTPSARVNIDGKRVGLIFQLIFSILCHL